MPGPNRERDSPVSWAIAPCTKLRAGLFLFPVAFPVFSTLGALAANVAVLVAVLWYQWAPTDLAA
jgi:hypothetical protein